MRGCPKTRLANATKWRDKLAAERAEVKARLRAAVLPGETMIPYCHDMALCLCEPMSGTRITSHNIPVPVIAVGRNRSRGYDRCLSCGAAWTLREYKWKPNPNDVRLIDVAAI